MGADLDAAVDHWHGELIGGGTLPCALTLIAVHGRPVCLRWAGLADVEQAVPCAADTVFRIFSMTKPIVAAATMALVDEGLIRLETPVGEVIPSFRHLAVNASTDPDRIEPVPAQTMMTIRHLLTHTGGLTYGGDPSAVSRLYVERRTDFGCDDGPLWEVVDRLARIPLLFEPGARWHYSVSHDVLGRVLEVVDGAPLDRVLRTRVLDPLGMSDTTFAPSSAQGIRLAALYEAGAGGFGRVPEDAGYPGGPRVTTLSGGAGLLSTASDYLRFAEMLRRSGEFDGVRVLSPESAALMQRNQLPGDIASCGEPTFSETPTRGVGFGLGGSVVVDPAVTRWTTSLAEYAWGGYASTAFLIDPTRDCVAIFLTQLIPSDAHPELRGGLRDHVARFVPSTGRL